MSEWDLYDDVTTKSSLLRVIEDKQSINLQTVNYLTYDHSNNKFLGITLEQPVRNIFVVDDLNEIIPIEIENAPSIDDIDSIKKTIEVAFELVCWAN